MGRDHRAVKVDGFEPEETKVGEVDPVTATLMTSKINLSNRIKLARRNRFGKADQSSPGRSKGIAIDICLCNEETASRIRLQILGIMAILLISKRGRPAGSSAKGIRDPKGNPGCLRESVDRVPTEVSEMRVRIRSA